MQDTSNIMLYQRNSTCCFFFSRVEIGRELVVSRNGDEDMSIPVSIDQLINENIVYWARSLFKEGWIPNSTLNSDHNNANPSSKKEDQKTKSKAKF